MAWLLEVAVGTGRNLPFYPPDVRLVGLDLSVGMLMRARDRARRLGLAVGLVHGDAQALPFADAVFDTVVCTLGLSSIPDDRAALAEMHRVLCGGGRLVLLGHVASSPHRPVRLRQRVLERVAATRTADTQRRQTAELQPAAGFTILYRRRSRGGIIERVAAATR